MENSEEMLIENIYREIGILLEKKKELKKAIVEKKESALDELMTSSKKRKWDIFEDEDEDFKELEKNLTPIVKGNVQKPPKLLEERENEVLHELTDEKQKLMSKTLKKVRTNYPRNITKQFK